MILTDPRKTNILLLLTLIVASLFAVAHSFIENRSYTSNIAASVNGKVLDQKEYINTLEALSSDRRDELKPSDETFILKRLIEEELLVQYALDNNLISTERNLRTLIASTMIESILATSSSTSSDETRIENYYAAHFNNPNRIKPKLSELREEIEFRLIEEDQDKAIKTYIKWLRQNQKSNSTFSPSHL